MMHMLVRTTLVTAFCFIVLPQAAKAQFGGGALGTFEPEGVFIDSDKVLRTRKLADGDELKKLMQKAIRHRPGNEELVYISLPRLFAEARELIDAGKPLPDEMKYLGGMVRLRYVFVDAQADDLVIAGPAEPFDQPVGGRMVGQLTGRPVLQLDDLVVALRTCGPGRAGRAFGCKIELTNQIGQRMVDAWHRHQGTAAVSPRKRPQIAQKISEAGGEQQVVLFQQQADTRFALVTVEADYMLKRLVLGLDRYPVIRSYLSLLHKPQVASNRFWFEASYDPLLVDPGGRAYEIRGQSLKISTRGTSIHDDSETKNPLAERYARTVTRQYDDLSKLIPSFADLANLSDLSLLAALIGRDKLHQKADLDLDWVLAQDGYPVAKVDVPESAASLANIHQNGRVVMFMAGGVLLDYDPTLKQREQDEQQTLDERTPRIGHGQWLDRQEPPSRRR